MAIYETIDRKRQEVGDTTGFKARKIFTTTVKILGEGDEGSERQHGGTRDAHGLDQVVQPDGGGVGDGELRGGAADAAGEEETPLQVGLQQQGASQVHPRASARWIVGH